MASSGTTSFNLTIDELIEEAYDRCGIETRSGYDLKTGKRSLNLLFLDLQNRHIPLWKMVLTSQSLAASTTSYTLAADIIDIESVVYRKDGVDVQLERLSRDEYQTRPDKDQTADRATQYWFEKLTTPVIHIWPVPNATAVSTGDTIRFYARERIEDVGAYTNTADIPANIIPIVISGLAYHIAVKRAPERAQLLHQLYEQELIRLEQEDDEKVSISILPGGGY